MLIMLLKATIGVSLLMSLWPVKAAFAAIKTALRPASGVLAALTALADKAVQNPAIQDPSELIDGRIYVFRHYGGSDIQRTFRRSLSAAMLCPEDAFTLAANSEIPDVKCFQKWLPSGEPTKASVWINMDCLFGAGPLRDTELRVA